MHGARVAMIAALAIGGCAEKPASPPPHAPAVAPPADAPSQGTTMLEVTITATGERPGRPPLIRLLVEASLANPGTEARWALIPAKLPAGAGGVDKLEQLSAGTVAVGRFLGRGGFYAVKLGPGAKVTLRNLELAWWSSAGTDAPPPFELRTGTGVTLGGAAIDTWFETDPAVTGTVAVDMDQAKHTRSQRSPDDKELDVAVTGGAATTIQLRVP